MRLRLRLRGEKPSDDFHGFTLREKEREIAYKYIIFFLFLLLHDLLLTFVDRFHIFKN